MALVYVNISQNSKINELIDYDTQIEVLFLNK